MLVPRRVRGFHDLLSRRPLRALAFQEVIPPEVSWISSWQLLSLPQPLTKRIALLPSEVGEGKMVAEEGWQEVAGSARWRMTSYSMRVHLKAGACALYIRPA